jgi:phenylalanyl-tRNA synthetase beta chain
VKGLVEGLLALPIEEGWTLHPFEGGDAVAATKSGIGWGISAAHLDPNASFEIRNRDNGFAGIAGPLLAGKADLPPWAGTVWAAEIALPATPTQRGALSFRAIPSHPGVDWDLALLLPAEVTSGAVRELARKVGGGILKEIGVFDVYRDKSMPSGVRSVAIRLRFQAEDRTLKDLEVDKVVQKIIGAFQEELHVGIRGQKG